MNILRLFMLALALFCLPAWLGATTSPNKEGFASYAIEANNKVFTTLIFPEAIEQVYSSSSNVLVTLAGNKVVLVELAAETKDKNSLTVMTAKNKLFTIVLAYAEELKEGNTFRIAQETAVFDEYGSEAAPQPKHDVNRFAKVLSARNNLFSVSNKAFGIKISLLGSYILKGTLYVKLRITNRTNLNYDLDAFTLYAWDLDDNVKREARTKRILPLLDIYPNIKVVPAKDELIVVLAFEKIVIANKKSLFVDVSERNSDRALTVPISYNSIKYPKRLN